MLSIKWPLVTKKAKTNVASFMLKEHKSLIVLPRGGNVSLIMRLIPGNKLQEISYNGWKNMLNLPLAHVISKIQF